MTITTRNAAAFEGLELGDCIIVMQTPEQRKLLEMYGRVLAIDATHRTSRYACKSSGWERRRSGWAGECIHIYCTGREHHMQEHQLVQLQGPQAH